MSLKSILAAIALSLAALVAQPASAGAPPARLVVESTTVMVSCENWGSGGFCEIHAPGAASYGWSTSGSVNVPRLCPTSSPLCEFGCPRNMDGYVTGRAYDASGGLIGSARRQICYGF